MDRLTRRENGKLLYRISPSSAWRVVDRCIVGYEAIKKLAHYEDLTEQGRLVELPCAVESILYRVVDGSVYEYFLDEFNVNKSGAHSMSISHAYEGHTFFINVSCDQIGKRFYTTREEAEAKLAEKGGGSDETD